MVSKIYRIYAKLLMKILSQSVRVGECMAGGSAELPDSPLDMSLGMQQIMTPD